MKIGCISDTHRTVAEIESNSLFSRQLARFNPDSAKAVYRKIAIDIDRAYYSALRWIGSNVPWDLLIHLGDVTGGHRGKGFSNPSVQQLAKTVVNDLKSFSGEALFVLGEHELRQYRHPNSFTGREINPNDIGACKQVFGELFWAREKQGVLLIGLCSPIAEYQGLNSEILRIQTDQRTFLGDILSGHKDPWILFTHTLYTPTFFVKEITGHTKNLKTIVCGDVHDPRKGKILKRMNQILGSFMFKAKNQTLTECLKKSIFCPSTAPLWWQGYGLLTLKYGKQKTLKANEIALNRPPDKEAPTSSLLRCLRWML